MTFQELMKQYVPTVVQRIQADKASRGVVPSSVMWYEFNALLMDDVRAAMQELTSEGIVRRGRALNGDYFCIEK